MSHDTALHWIRPLIPQSIIYSNWQSLYKVSGRGPSYHLQSDSNFYPPDDIRKIFEGTISSVSHWSFDGDFTFFILFCGVTERALYLESAKQRIFHSGITMKMDKIGNCLFIHILCRGLVEWPTLGDQENSHTFIILQNVQKHVFTEL